MISQLSGNDKNILLSIARAAITNAVKKERLQEIKLMKYSDMLQREGASFVTLTKNGKLRGCIGTLEASQPLILDVQEHAVAAAMKDYRFPTVKEEEIKDIKIEISRLTPIQKIEYGSTEELLGKLRFGVGGVLIKAHGRRATFLPQVWNKVPESEQFLSQLCRKMGASPDLWRKGNVEIFTYQVEKFEEA